MLRRCKHPSMEAVCMILAASSELGKSDAAMKLAALASNLTTFVAQAARDGSNLYDVERAVLNQLLVMGRVAVDLFFQAQGTGDLGPSVTTESGTVLHRSDTMVPR